MKQVFSITHHGAWILALGIALAGCSQAGGDESAETTGAAVQGETGTPAEKARSEGQAPPAGKKPVEQPPQQQADVSQFDKEAAVAEARRQQQRRPTPEVTQAPPAGGAPSVDTSSLSPAPSWQVPNLAGGTMSSTEVEGKVVILDFWATWCGPCKMEIPHFIELYAEYGDLGLEIIGVNVGEPPARVAPFVERAGITYPTVLATQKIYNDYSPIPGLPTTYIISKDGKIYRRYVGYKPKAVFERDVRALLGMAS